MNPIIEALDMWATLRQSQNAWDEVKEVREGLEIRENKHEMKDDDVIISKESFQKLMSVLIENEIDDSF